MSTSARRASRPHFPVLILGAGPTGLGAAWRLHELGRSDWMLLEMSDHPGGLSSSFVDPQGFTWDVGGHVQFSHYAYFDAVMDRLLGPDGWLEHRRESWVWMRDRFIPYPLQNNLHRLPEPERSRCLQGLEEAAREKHAEPRNFREWILATMGPGIADAFLFPYNSKVWAYPPEVLSTVWIGDRVAVTDPKRVQDNTAAGTDDVSWGPNATFRYPKRGGTGSIWRACAAHLPAERIGLGTRVTHVDLTRRAVKTSDGRILTYDSLISTLPLRELLRMAGEHQFDAIAERGLLHSSTNIVGLGLRGQPRAELASKSWIYFPEANCPFYRATLFSRYSPDLVPDSGQNWSLMCEVSESALKPVDQEALRRDVVQGALKTSLIGSESEIVSTWMYRAAYGYPTPGLHRDEALAQILPFLEARHVHSRGRFGLWKYEVSNQDHSFMQGVEVVERLQSGRPEITAHDAAYANSKKHPWPFERWT